MVQGNIKRQAGPANRQSVGGKRKQLTQREVFEHAMKLLETRSFLGTSMNDIAVACGVSKPSLYYWVRDKSHLLELLYEDITEEMFAHARRLVSAKGPADVRLEELLSEQILYNIRNRRFLTIFWAERHQLNQEARAALAVLEREFEQAVQRIIVDGIQAGLFRPCDPKIVTFTILGLLSTVQRWSIYTDADASKIRGEVTAMTLNGLRK